MLAQMPLQNDVSHGVSPCNIVLKLERPYNGVGWNEAEVFKCVFLVYYGDHIKFSCINIIIGVLEPNNVVRMHEVKRVTV